jgi:hypothetical protein
MHRIFRELEAIIQQEIEVVSAKNKRTVIKNSDIAADKIILHLMDKNLLKTRAVIKYCKADGEDGR